jgi:hypothetical protein
MFISQNTMMGRVNIAFSLLGKDIISTRPVAWVTSIMQKSKWTIGEKNFSFVALLSMFAKSGRIPFDELIRALYNENEPNRKLYKNILENIRLPYIENILGKVALKKDITFSNSELFKKF